MSPDAYTRIFEPLVFPMLDRLNRTSIAAKFAALTANECRDRAEIRDEQLGALERAVGYARDASVFYRDFWRSAPAERRLPSAYAGLDGLPVITKADLAAAPAAFPLAAYRGRVIASRTSGSTGSPMTFYRSAEQESWFWALRFRIWSWGGYRPGMPYLTINLNPRTAWSKRLQDVLMRCAYLTYNAADNLDAARIVDCLRRRRITQLNGFSSSLFALARYMLAHDIRIPSVEGVTSTGDTLYPLYRQTIEEAFGVRVLDYYGAGGEGVHLASQCPLSQGRYHVLPENALVEILGADGPVPPGVAGRVVITQFHNDAMPLVRYELGDVAVAAPDGAQCPCGRTLPLLERVEGRIPDLIVAPDGSFLVPHFFVVLFKNLQSVAQYQVIQDERDRIRVRLVARDRELNRDVEAIIRREVGNATRGTLAAGVEWVDEIPLSGSGKRRLVISAFGREALGSAAEPQPVSISA